MNKLPPMSEKAWQQRVTDYATTQGWIWNHLRNVMVAGRYTVPYATGSAPGLPDLILARMGVVLLVELKSQYGRLGKGQQLWIDHGAHLWRPSDWDALVIPTLRRAA